MSGLDNFLGNRYVEFIPVSLATADRFGRIAASLRRKGTPIRFYRISPDGGGSRGACCKFRASEGLTPHYRAVRMWSFGISVTVPDLA